MLRSIYGALSALLLAGLTPACIASTDADEDQDLSEQSAALSSCPTQIPDALVVPQGNHLAFTLQGRGDQVYGCKLNAGAYAWTLIAPDADLFSPHGCLAGTHYAGPTWEALDGSTVVGSKLAAVTVDATAIPWLLLGAVSHAGDGRMTKVTFVQRVSTVGGLAPTSGCDATHEGETKSVSYSATYRFFEANRRP